MQTRSRILLPIVKLHALASGARLTRKSSGRIKHGSKSGRVSSINAIVMLSETVVIERVSMMLGKSWNELAGKSLLSQPIKSSKLPLIVRHQIANRIFQSNLTIEHFLTFDEGLRSWFSHWVEDQCEGAAPQVSATTYQELLHILNCLQSKSKTISRAGIADHLRQNVSAVGPTTKTAVTDESLNASLTLAARLWSSMSIDSIPHCLTPGYYVSWNNDEHFNDVLGKAFCPKPQSTESITLPKVFTAANIEMIAGIKVQWSSNLADHLVLKDDDSKVTIFYHASFLELSRNPNRYFQILRSTVSPLLVTDNDLRTLLQHDLIEETLRTLALLIPSHDARSRRWFREKQRVKKLDPRAGSYRSSIASTRQIDKYHYWRDRLVILKQTFDDSEPNTIASWWYDDRKKVQWYTFWVAALVLLLTVVFGLIQSISAVVQAWATVSALKAG